MTKYIVLRVGYKGKIKHCVGDCEEFIFHSLVDANDTANELGKKYPRYSYVTIELPLEVPK